MLYVLIQKIIRGFITRSIIKRIYGPAFTNPLLCKNDVDLASLETIWEMKGVGFDIGKFQDPEKERTKGIWVPHSTAVNDATIESLKSVKEWSELLSLT